MGKLPTTLLRRPSLAPGSALSSTSTTATTPRVPLAHAPQPSSQQVRHASYVLRSRRPYQFTQLVQLSDGSTYTMRTTSPVALYKAAKDSRNHILWQPSEKSLRNVEVDEAGKLAAFRERYGKAWDLGGPSTQAGEEQPQADAPALGAASAKEGVKGEAAKAGKVEAKEAKPEEDKAKAPVEAAAPEEDPFDSLVDLISAYATEDKNVKGGLSAKDQARKEKNKKK